MALAGVQLSWRLQLAFLQKILHTTLCKLANDIVYPNSKAFISSNPCFNSDLVAVSHCCNHDRYIKGQWVPDCTEPCWYIERQRTSNCNLTKLCWYGTLGQCSTNIERYLPRPQIWSSHYIVRPSKVCPGKIWPIGPSDQHCLVKAPGCMLTRAFASLGNLESAIHSRKGRGMLESSQLLEQPNLEIHTVLKNTHTLSDPVVVHRVIVRDRSRRIKVRRLRNGCKKNVIVPMLRG